MIFAGQSYEKLARTVGNTTTTKTTDKSDQRTYSEIYRSAAMPVYLLECSDAGALQLLIMSQENYKARLERVMFNNSGPPPVGVMAADGALWGPNKEAFPWVFSIDMDLTHIDRALRQSLSAGYPGLMIVCLPEQEKALAALYGDKTKIGIVRDKDLMNAFGLLRLREPEGVYLDNEGGMIDAANLPIA